MKHETAVCRSTSEVLRDSPGIDPWVAASAADMSCRAAAIEATRTGTTSGRESSWRLGKSPSDYDR